MTAKITIIGTGYVGLVSGACFSALGHDVICVDQDRRKIDMLNSGKLPIYEPGLDELVHRSVEQGTLHFSTDTAASVKGRDAVFIAVGTPSDGPSGNADLRYVFGAAQDIARALDKFTVIITKSTVPVGTNRRVFDNMLGELGGDELFAVASNPEFLREGVAIHDFMQPDRIVVGISDARAQAVLERIYAPLTSREIPFVVTNIETAEVIKYAANAFLAVKVSFINEVADLCEATGANVRDVAHGIGLDHRIGKAFLNTGPGWGGSCFPKDTRALLMTAQASGVPARIVSAAMDANAQRKRSMIERIRAMCGGDLSGKRVAVLGVTFKGQTDDMRESPALDILPGVVEAGAEVAAYDPSDPHEASNLLPSVKMVKSAVEAATHADLLVVMTDWMAFKSLDLVELSAVMRNRSMLDLRNLFTPDLAGKGGFQTYRSLGESPSKVS